MKIAIVGAGFCGLAATWHLIQRFPHSQITLFDSKGIGGGASGIAAGLFHPYAGSHSKLNKRGREAFDTSLELLNAASQALGYSVLSSPGILRPATTTMQNDDFKTCHVLNDWDTEWWNSDRCQKMFPYLTANEGLWIKSGFVVNCAQYLMGLWEICSNKGVKLEIETIPSLDYLQQFTIKILAVGANFHQFSELSLLSLSVVKGQILELEWPSYYPHLSIPLNGHAYVIMDKNQKTCLAGATFERGNLQPFPDIQRASDEILPKVNTMLPLLKEATIRCCRVGFRVGTPQRLPLIKKIGCNEWAITGMGSKGLLYHALFAKELVEDIIQTGLFV